MSRLSTRDYVRIVATYGLQSGEHKELSDDELKGRGYNTAAINAIKKQKTGNAGYKSQGLQFTGSLSDHNYSLMDYLFTLFVAYERGVLPFIGSLSEQPAQIIEAFNLIHSLQIERSQRQQKAEQSEHGRNNKNKHRISRQSSK